MKTLALKLCRDTKSCVTLFAKAQRAEVSLQPSRIKSSENKESRATIDCVKYTLKVLCESSEYNVSIKGTPCDIYII